MGSPLLFLPLLALVGTGPAPAGYQRPPAAIRAVLDAPPPPAVLLAPGGEQALLVEVERYPTLDDLARPVMRLAGTRFNPVNRAPHLPLRLRSLALLALPGGRTRPVALPGDRAFGLPQWAPDGRAFAIQAVTARSVELWLGDAATGRLRPVPNLHLNAAFGNPVSWMPGSRALLCETVPARPGPAPQAPDRPAGPRVQEAGGDRPEPTRTYADLLQDPLDEARYTYYATAQLAVVDRTSGKAAPLGRPAVFADAQVAPDGSAVLVGRIHPPYSYLVPADNFPRRWEVWDRAGRCLRTLADQDLAEGIPIEGVRTGPRRIQWLPARGATLAWVEALDGGDPRTPADHRDALMELAAPFQGEPREVHRTEHRLVGLDGFPADGRLLVREYQRDQRRLRTWLLDPGGPGPEAPVDATGTGPGGPSVPSVATPGPDLPAATEAVRLVWDLNIQDRYRDPGTPLTRLLANGQRALWLEDGQLVLAGPGATPEGDRPFLDLLDPATLRSTRRFQATGPGLETPLAPLPGGRLLTRRESPSDPPNLYLREPDGTVQVLTTYVDPAPELRRVRKQLVTCQRADGVALSFTLYLPPGHRDGDRLPALLWAYPQEFTDSGVAGQVNGSSQRFTQVYGPSPVLLALAGYAVLMDATMPVVGPPRTANDTYLEQVAAAAEAAIRKGDAMGAVDPARVAVGGHSYGAFMTANLLAHTTLFKAGIARSGAYNRTLTPFGYQNEVRTLWEAPDTYLKVSPFLAADRFSAPILLIHGEADENSGTFPLQSERLFQALKGNGKPVRYVTLPLEGHAYQARESVEHVLWEMIRWLDAHL